MVSAGGCGNLETIFESRCGTLHVNGAGAGYEESDFVLAIGVAMRRVAHVRRLRWTR